MDPKRGFQKLFEDIKSAKSSDIRLIRDQYSISAGAKRKIYYLLGATVGYWLLVNCIGMRFLTNQCAVTLPDPIARAFRPVTDCGFCRTVDDFDVVQDLSPAEFESRYAYTGRPVKVADGARNWSAVTVFDYWYFEQIYDEFERRGSEFNCQFFPYKSGFSQIFHAFDMPERRINQEAGTDPWYFGWSNCNNEIAQTLRQHYSKPYFLPVTSENNAIDWIFMGVPGMGAHLHVDNVRLPSWQAQLKGSKEWTLAPPPECYYQCNFFRVTVNPGEIIVLDTNKWFHMTNVLPGEVSVTIGAEYD